MPRTPPTNDARPVLRAAPPAPRRLHHAAIICADPERSKRFYTQVLGLAVVAETWRESRRSWKIDLALADGSQVELFSFPGAPPRPSYPEAQGLRHLAFVVDDLDVAIAHLREQGVAAEPIRVDELTGHRFTFFADPDDLPLELVEVRPAAAAPAATDVAPAASFPRRAAGTFDVRITPIEPGSLAAGRMRIEKAWHGELVGTSVGEMLSAGDPASGSAGYVAMEIVDATLAGRHGGFALQHAATMHAGARELRIVVAPGSGTGALAGIAGRLDIVIEQGRHSYEFAYALPEDDRPA